MSLNSNFEISIAKFKKYFKNMRSFMIYHKNQNIFIELSPCYLLYFENFICVFFFDEKSSKLSKSNSQIITKLFLLTIKGIHLKKG